MTCGVVIGADVPACLRVAGGARAKRWKFSTLTIGCHEDSRPLMTFSSMPDAARTRYLLDLLAQLPTRVRRGRRHALAGLLAVGITAVVAGLKSFAAIGQWASDAGPDVPAALQARTAPADESTYRRAFALVSVDIIDRVLGIWLQHQGCPRGRRRLVVAIDGKTVRGAKDENGKARTWSRPKPTASARSPARSRCTRRAKRSPPSGTC